MQQDFQSLQQQRHFAKGTVPPFCHPCHNMVRYDGSFYTTQLKKAAYQQKTALMKANRLIAKLPSWRLIVPSPPSLKYIAIECQPGTVHGR